MRAWTAAGALLLAFAAGAEEPAPESARDADPEAIAIVSRMSELLAKVQTLHYVADTAYDSVQIDGQKIEFGARREVTARRPDRIRLDTVDRDGTRRTIRYDGKLLSVVNESEKAFATVEHTGTIDTLADYVHADLGIPTPLSELLSPDLPKLLTEKMLSARYVGAELLGDTRCDHLAFRNEEVGVQLWITEAGAPRRVVINYETSVGEPQFRADFVKWEIAAPAPDALFRFQRPPGYERVVFIPRKRSPPAPEAKP